MELVVRKNDLLRELQLFQGIVERKNTIPILANVLMEAKGDQVSFLATDLEVGLRSKCAATVTKPGSLTLPAKKFYEIVKSLPGYRGIAARKDTSPKRLYCRKRKLRVGGELLRFRVIAQVDVSLEGRLVAEELVVVGLVGTDGDVKRRVEVHPGDIGVVVIVGEEGIGARRQEFLE